MGALTKTKQHALALRTKPRITELRWEDVDWADVDKNPDCALLGLCNRHVQIDDTGRDWYGLPLLVDAAAYAVQGSPYTTEFKTYHEKELNDILWAQHFLTKRHTTSSERTLYTQYVSKVPIGGLLLSEEAYFLRVAYRRMCLGIYPSPRLARFYIDHETTEQLQARDAAAETKGHRYATNLERFGQLDYIGRILFVMDGQVRNLRRNIYFAKLQADQRQEQLVALAGRKIQSQQHWGAVDRDRKQLRQQWEATRRENPAQAVWPMADQLSMFPTESAVETIDYVDTTTQLALPPPNVHD